MTSTTVYESFNYNPSHWRYQASRPPAQGLKLKASCKASTASTLVLFFSPFSAHLFSSDPYAPPPSPPSVPFYRAQTPRASHSLSSSCPPELNVHFYCHCHSCSNSPRLPRHPTCPHLCPRMENCRFESSFFNGLSPQPPPYPPLYVLDLPLDLDLFLSSSSSLSSSSLSLSLSSLPSFR